MGIIIYYGDWLLPPVGRLFVAQRVDHYFSNIWIASQKPRTSSTIDGDMDLTDLNGMTLEAATPAVNEHVKAKQAEKVLHIKKYIIFITLCLILGVVCCSCCYCCYLGLKCRCKVEPCEIPKVYCDNAVAPEHMFIPQTLEGGSRLKSLNPKKIRWCNPRSTFMDVVVPFFVLFQGMYI